MGYGKEKSKFLLLLETLHWKDGRPALYGVTQIINFLFKFKIALSNDLSHSMAALATLCANIKSLSDLSVSCFTVFYCLLYLGISNTIANTNIHKKIVPSVNLVCS